MLVLTVSKPKLERKCNSIVIVNLQVVAMRVVPSKLVLLKLEINLGSDRGWLARS